MTNFFMLESAYDGLSISVAAVYPENHPKAVLHISHGMCGCKERFLPLMEYMAAHGVACVANDHRGHGLSVKNEKVVLSALRRCFADSMRLRAGSSGRRRLKSGSLLF